MSTPSPLDAPQHVLSLLSTLHKLSIEQEVAVNGKIKAYTEDRKANPDAPRPDVQTTFDALMLDKFIALDEDKCHFMYQLITATGATNIVEAGTSFGVSTIYLALAIAKTKKATGKEGKVIATEKEKSKAEQAKKYWKQCGEEVEREIELREGNLLETLKTDLPELDLLLLDIWTPMALPTLKTVLPKLRHGAVVLADNTAQAADGYKEYLAFIRAPENCFRTITLPYSNGFEMSVYSPISK